MTLFSKLKQPKEERQKIRELTLRIMTITDEVEKLFVDKKASLFEVMDIVRELQTRVNLKAAELLQQRNQIIEKLQTDAEKKPTNDTNGKNAG